MAFSLHTLKSEILDYITKHANLVAELNIHNIYDHIPLNMFYPFMIIGDLEVRNWDSQLSDGREIFFTTEIFDDSLSGERASIIAHNSELLLTDLTLSSYQLISIQLETTKAITRMQGGRFHIQQYWRLVIEH